VNCLRFIFLIIGIVLVTIPILLSGFIARILRLKSADKIPQIYHKILLRIVGVRVTVQGALKLNVPLVVVSNHISWLDIMVISASFPCYFIAKSEIADWPIFGFLAKMQNTIFVNRKARGSQIGEQVNDIASVLKQKKTIILFPEGTTSDGNCILKFKSALLAAAKATDNYQPFVQPLCLHYQKMSGMPMTRTHRPFVAWYGDMNLLPHIKAMLRFTPIDVNIHIGEASRYDDFNSRQEMAEHLEGFMRNVYTNNSIN
jgi:1-acyl-sn-glycerol-3-phosphate acyltransferase